MDGTKKERDSRLDAIRGLLLVLIGIDHLQPFRPNILESIGFLSAAEGFIFLSGYVGGLKYSYILCNDAHGAAWRSALRRAIEIYSYHMATFLILFVLVHLFGTASG